MAAVDVTITGVLYDKQNRTTQNVVLIGEASLTGVGVGGGPIIPPAQPPGIWGGGNEPFPTPPIHLPPTNPPIIWGGGNEPFPTPPIVIPPTPPVNLPPGGTPLPPAVGVPIEGHIVFIPGYGWVFVPKKNTPEAPEEQ